MREVFYWILNMSIMATIYGSIIFLIRLIKPIPRVYIYLLWAVVFLRLLCPVGITSKYSFVSMVSTLTNRTVAKSISIKELEGKPEFPQLTVSNMIQVADTYQPITYKTNRMEYFFQIAAWIWIIVGAILILLMGTMYLIAMKDVKKASRLRDNIYLSPMVMTPAVYGIRKPKILLPLNTEINHREHILAHEAIHIRRKDNVWRMIALLIVCIHWFNPLLWIFLECFTEDCELACDEKAIQSMNKEERKAYGKTLLMNSTRDKGLFLTAFGSSGIKKRIHHVITYQKISVFSSICLSFMLLVLGVLMLTNGVN